MNFALIIPCDGFYLSLNLLKKNYINLHTILNNPINKL
ncbi:hypothetical protein APA_1437 [Pseudanabaena sp. lw0831]|nr:hypothetical protein APA_1437 [Pseudanabaena sp. lw0831]